MTFDLHVLPIQSFVFKRVSLVSFIHLSHGITAFSNAYSYILKLLGFFNAYSYILKWVRSPLNLRPFLLRMNPFMNAFDCSYSHLSFFLLFFFFLPSPFNKRLEEMMSLHFSLQYIFHLPNIYQPGLKYTKELTCSSCAEDKMRTRANLSNPISFPCPSFSPGFCYFCPGLFLPAPLHVDGEQRCSRRGQRLSSAHPRPLWSPGSGVLPARSGLTLCPFGGPHRAPRAAEPRECRRARRGSVCSGRGLTRPPRDSVPALAPIKAARRGIRHGLGEGLPDPHSCGYAGN